MSEHDRTDWLQQQVQLALEASEPHALTLKGAGSRGNFFPAADASLSVGDHCGVIEYQPDELMLKVRAGTPLIELESLLAAHGQQLAADIPCPDEHSTIGGAIASGWDGPARAFGMSLRDSVVGCRLINGRGQVVNFGGQVMKNVAGYDFARLQVGALGTLGLILDVSLRLLPRAEFSVSRSFAVNPKQPEALQEWWKTTRELRPLLNGTCFHEGQLHLRLSGRESAISAALDKLGGDESTLDWQALKNLRSGFFHQADLACAYLPRYRHFVPVTDEYLGEWEGARVWVRGGDHHQLARDAAAAGGFLRVFRGEPALPQPRGSWGQRIRDAFDPHGIFNRELYQVHFGGPETSSSVAPDSQHGGSRPCK